MRARLLILPACAVLFGLTPAVSSAGAASLRVDVVSNRADLISGGDALVAVHSASPGDTQVTLNGNPLASSTFHWRATTGEGLVKGLHVGRNVIAAQSAGRTARARIVDHPSGGPIFSGPQVKPWVCQNAGATDAQCDQPPTFELKYMSSVTQTFEPYNPSSPPLDLATTTTDEGRTVPFIVRFETGYLDRDQYEIAELYDPSKPWTPWNPQKQWNHKLLITHGASCGIDHQTGTAPSVTGDTTAVSGTPGAGQSPTTALGLGFAVMSTALDNAGHNCNLATQAESLVMAKEHLIEELGSIRYTIGTGCSGGSLAQQQIANAYPGVYQGILPQCSFQDAWSNAEEISDYHQTRKYFENPTGWGTGVAWSYNQISAVEGHPNYGNPIIFDTVYWEELANPTKSCPGVAAGEAYNPQSNPNGARCTLADYMINVFGPRTESVWGPVEKAIGHGFAGRPVGNVGVQYGLRALQEGIISPAQFADLNAKVGGADIDLNPTRERIRADEPAVKYAYQSGAVNEANNLTDVPIIDLRGPDPGAFHDAYRSWTMRARLEHAEKHFPKNHVIWFGHV
ncbi:MAG: hypothetical protein QOJ01_927, partial [Solirubrobacterales bacterium]|nr:hypothetical protein [Solirubrobacterales bacterium]